jgi:hypothetical protein
MIIPSRAAMLVVATVVAAGGCGQGPLTPMSEAGVALTPTRRAPAVPAAERGRLRRHGAYAAGGVCRSWMPMARSARSATDGLMCPLPC